MPYICLRCANTPISLAENSTCPDCGSSNIVGEKSLFSSSKEHVAAIEDTMLNPLFEQELFELHMKKVYERIKKMAEVEDTPEYKAQIDEVRAEMAAFRAAQHGAVTCPKCGSTQIQAVNRKWSIWTGFLTNKVDRVCLSCKNRF